MSTVDEIVEETAEEEKKGKKKKKEEPIKYEIIVEAPKSRLITAIVMLSGGLIVAIVTCIMHYDLTTWLKTLIFSLVIFLIAGLLLEWMITHFLDLNNARDEAIAAQEEAIAQREADELAAAEAAAQAEAEALLAEQEGEEGQEQEYTPNEFKTFGESDEFDDL